MNTKIIAQRRATQADREQVIELLDQSMTPRQVAARLGLDARDISDLAIERLAQPLVWKFRC